MALVDAKPKTPAEAMEEALEELEAARTAKDKKKEAAALRKKGGAHQGLEEFDNAVEALTEALAISKEAKDGTGEVEALQALSFLYLASRGATPEAVRWGNEAVAAARKADDKKLEAETLKAMISIQLAKKDTADALRLAGEIRELHQKEGDTDGELTAMQLIVEIHLETDNATEAQATARDAILLCQAFGSRKMEATFLHLIAVAALTKDKNHEAHALYLDVLRTTREALEILAEVGDKQIEAAVMLTAARAYLAKGDGIEALQMATDAAGGFRQEGDSQGRGGAMHVCAGANMLLGQAEAAAHAAREALVAFRHSGDRQGQAAAESIISALEQPSAPQRPGARPALADAEGGKRPVGYAEGPALPTNCEAGGEQTKDFKNAYSAETEAWSIPKNPRFTLNIDCNQPDTVKSVITAMPRETIVWSHALADNSMMAMNVDLCMLLVAMANAQLRTPIICTTRGVHSRPMGEHAGGSMTMASGNTLWGMIRTARQEMPNIPITLVDVSPQYTAAEVAACIQPPPCYGPMTGEAAYYHGTKFDPYIDQVESLFKNAKRETGPHLTGTLNSNAGKSKDSKPAFPKRTNFGWKAPDHKLDNCWYSQRWRSAGPCEMF